MRRIARGLAFAAALGVAGVGCFLVTGGTSGYTLAPPDAGVCSIDSGLGSALTCGCASSADCPTTSGATFCCFTVSATSESASSTCQTTPCDASVGAQLCKKAAECVDAACVLQSCSFGELSIPVQACGSLSGCAP